MIFSFITVLGFVFWFLQIKIIIRLQKAFTKFQAQAWLHNLHFCRQ